MEIRQLEYFAAIAQMGGFRPAARELNLSPATLSEQIGYLERELGVRLFERVGRRVTLTDAGRKLRESTQRALADFRSARQEMLDLARLDSGELIVGAMPGRGFLWLPGFLDAFMQSHPQLDFRLIERSMTGLIKGLENGEIHTACVSVAEGTAFPPGISFRVVDRGELAVVVHPGHVLAQSGTVSVSDLVGEPLILASREDTTRLMLDSAFAALGLEPNVRFEANDPLTLIRLAGRGLGIGVTFARHGRSSQAEAVVTIPFGAPMLRVDFGVAWARERGAHLRGTNIFVDFFATWWREHPEEHPAFTHVTTTDRR